MIENRERSGEVNLQRQSTAGEESQFSDVLGGGGKPVPSTEGVIWGRKGGQHEKSRGGGKKVGGRRILGGVRETDEKPKVQGRKKGLMKVEGKDWKKESKIGDWARNMPEKTGTFRAQSRRKRRR